VAGEIMSGETGMPRSSLSHRNIPLKKKLKRMDTSLAHVLAGTVRLEDFFFSAQ
jgi:hypothetical protein